MEAVIHDIEQEPETSTRVIARNHDLPYSTVQRILAEEKLHAFHYTHVHHLRAEDYPRRKNFCEDLLRKVNQDPRYLFRVIFNDESLFTQEGIFNSHNHHYWSDENPQLIRQRSFQTRWKRNVWAGIMGSQILGPIYFPDNINGANYLEFLQNTMPEFLEEI